MRRRLAIIILDGLDIDVLRGLSSHNILRLYNERYSNILTCSTFPHTCPSDNCIFSGRKDVFYFWIKHKKIGDIWIDPASVFNREREEITDKDVRLLNRKDFPYPYLWDIAEYAGLNVEVVQVPIMLPPYSFNAHRETKDWFPHTEDMIRRCHRDKAEITMESLQMMADGKLDLFITSFPYMDKILHGIAEGVVSGSFLEPEAKFIDEMMGEIDEFCMENDITYAFFGDHGSPVRPGEPRFNRLWGKNIICVVHRQHSIIVSNYANPPGYTEDLFNWFLKILEIPKIFVQSMDRITVPLITSKTNGEKVLAGDLFELKIKKSLGIIEQAINKWYPKMGVVWSTGKDSMVMLFLARQLKPDVKVLFGDTGVHFQETYDFRDRITEEWNLNIINMVPDVEYEEVKGNRERCCHNLKTLPALKTIRELGLKAVLVGIRWSEHPVRSQEDYFSKRKNHFRVHPMLHWTEKEIWRFIKSHNIPYNPLYDKGFRSIGCAPCTIPASPEAEERAGRARDKEEIMKRLRALGYW